jgi:iron(III) transport system ATP-binding protein
MTTKTQYLVIENLTKDFGSFRALNDISIGIDEGEFVCFLGPSGCGKTTLLRCIAGLELQSSGSIFQNEKLISNLPTSQRDFGIVFQSYALFPNLSCFENISYGLKSLGWEKKAVAGRVNELLALIGLSDHATKYPSQLSGGEQQRIALARAIATSPNLLLLDEPLSALDAKVRVHLRQELKKFHRRLGLTTIMVTHDQEEALSIADRIFVMKDGEMMQSGTPEEIYMNPANPFVANFIGMTNFLQGEIADEKTIKIGGKNISAVCRGFSKGEQIRLAARPEAIQITKKNNNAFSGKIVDWEFLGSFVRLHVDTPLMPGEHMLVDKPMLENSDISITLNSEINFTFSSELLNIYKIEG